MRTGLRGSWVWRQRSSAWGAVLDEQTLVLAALVRQSHGGVRVAMFERVQTPDGLVRPVQRDAWLVQSLQGAAEQLPRRQRVMALALHESRCSQGVLVCDAAGARMQARQVREAAARAMTVPPDAIGYDFVLDEDNGADGGGRVRWAACLREDLLNWQTHARRAGWRLPVVEPADQAVVRAATHWRGPALHHWVTSPRDWQFDDQAQRRWQPEDGPLLRASTMWAPLAACGAALGLMA